MSFPTKTALVLAVVVAALGVGRTQSPGAGGAEARESGNVVPLRAVQDEETDSIAIYREGEDEPIVTQNAGPDGRLAHPRGRDRAHPPPAHRLDRRTQRSRTDGGLAGVRGRGRGHLRHGSALGRRPAGGAAG